MKKIVGITFDVSGDATDISSQLHVLTEDGRIWALCYRSQPFPQESVPFWTEVKLPDFPKENKA